MPALRPVRPGVLAGKGHLPATDIARTIDIVGNKGNASATFKYSALVLPPDKTRPELRDGAASSPFGGTCQGCRG
jgi:hypothetical protein